MEFFDVVLCVIYVEIDDIGEFMVLDDFKVFFVENFKYNKLSFYELNGDEVDVVLSGFMEVWDIDIMVLFVLNYGFFESIFY